MNVVRIGETPIGDNFKAVLIWEAIFRVLSTFESFLRTGVQLQGTRAKCSICNLQGEPKFSIVSKRLTGSTTHPK